MFEAAIIAQIIVDIEGRLRHANEKARSLFRLSAGDVQRPLQDLELSYRPVELRSCIDQVYADQRQIILNNVPWTTNGADVVYLDVHIAAIVDTAGSLIGASVAFVDVTRYMQLQEELQDATQELERAYGELQSTNEELETTNEELQSTNEELETTNEELQSSNEELETMNEELQSTNEELQSTNEESRQRSNELNRANAFINSVLGGLRSGVIVLNSEMEIQLWNPKIQELWGLSQDEVSGKHFMNLDIGLPV